MRPRIGLIGAGLIGRFHSRGVHGLIKNGFVDADYVAVCDRDIERAEAFARLAGIDAVTSDPAEIIESADVNTIYVCTPTAEHKALVLAAAAAGKHVFCEKPLAKTLADAEEMLAAVQDAGVGHQVGLILRHAPIFTVLKELTSDPALGRLMTIVFRDEQAFPINDRYGSKWRADPAVAGGGTLIEHSIHDLDLLSWLGGGGESVQAQTRNFAGHKGVEDLATVTLDFASGATAQLTSVWHQIGDRPSTRLLELFFEKGYFAVDQDFLGSISYETNASGGKGVVEESEVISRYLSTVGLAEDRYADALRKYSLEDFFFLKALSDDRAPAPGFDVAVAAHRLVDAVYRSAADNGALVPLS
jgi:predicted dehydrogenase